MKNIYLLIAFILPLLINAQSVDDLDAKNGFKDFKLGDSYDKWSTQIMYLKTNEDGIKVYKYKGNCCNKIFDYNINQLSLGFMDSKLAIIYIETEKFQKPYTESNEFTKWRSDDFEKINNSFKLLFGEPTGSNTNDNISFYWEGKNTLLMSTYKYLGVREGDMQIIYLFSKDYLKKQIASGF